MLFWTVVIIGGIWWLMKSKLGGGNDLTAHLAEQRALQSVGNSATSANQIATGNWPLTTIGDTAFAGLNLDPFNSANPFAQPKQATILPGTANAASGGYMLF